MRLWVETKIGMVRAIICHFLATASMLPIEVSFERNTASGDEYLSLDEENNDRPVYAKYLQFSENTETAVIEVNFGASDFRQLGVVNITDPMDAETNTATNNTSSTNQPIPPLVVTLAIIMLSYLLIHSIMITIWSLIDSK